MGGIGTALTKQGGPLRLGLIPAGRRRDEGFQLRGGTSAGVEDVVIGRRRTEALEELAVILGRSPETIRKDIRRNPDAVPPRLHLPGTRLLRWRASDVDAWLAVNVQKEARHG